MTTAQSIVYSFIVSILIVVIILLRLDVNSLKERDSPSKSDIVEVRERIDALAQTLGYEYVPVSLVHTGGKFKKIEAENIGGFTYDCKKGGCL